MLLKRPLVDTLKNYKSKKMSSFHVPGHKNKFKFKSLIDLDYTELIETDSLFHSSSCILKAEEKTAKLFNAKKTLFSTGGSTNCIQAMLKLVAEKGKKIITSRVIHISAINTMNLLDLTPVFITPKFNEITGFFEQITAREIKQSLAENKDAAAVYITSPDYFGTIADVSGISKVCKEQNVPLLVDAAHGSHLKFLPNSLYPGDFGADMVALSAHKNLPVLTGGAWLNIHNKKYVKAAKNAMMTFSSTSPSYVIMASLDTCAAWLEKNGKTEFKKLLSKVSKIKEKAKKLGMQHPENLDPIKITLNPAAVGISGNEFANYLRENKIEPEMHDENLVVLIPSPFNKNKDFKRLNYALDHAKFSGIPKIKKPNLPLKLKFAVSPHEAILSRGKIISVKSSIGEISAQNVCTCPPGVPLVMAGEKIKDENIASMQSYGIEYIKVLY